MDRDEKTCFVALGEGGALVERNERVVASRHQNFVAAGLFEEVAQDMTEGENDILFDRAELYGA